MIGRITKAFNRMIAVKEPPANIFSGPNADDCTCPVSVKKSPVGSPEGDLVNADNDRLKYNINASYWSGDSTPRELKNEHKRQEIIQGQKGVASGMGLGVLIIGLMVWRAYS